MKYFVMTLNSDHLSQSQIIHLPIWRLMFLNPRVHKVLILISGMERTGIGDFGTFVLGIRLIFFLFRFCLYVFYH